ncbi:MULTISPECIES: cupredoxin domain-containing protein [Hymenobacter]|uniref:Cupredoxin-like domain-containing protein n=1 Tax=Hymenobacter psychrotolerans DSM 18569 TaxID=1121959 RepID=A0A1M6ZZD5_9BACT|nr:MULTISPECIES: cupredoxin domain-containing protein [Hymenobacter]QNE42052.1 cupredoxin domain-containing protein [Hymenobacter sp. NBH84]SHL35898.1 Cupredoxin-like domain-containing protein [Hymenobacter psychrotolerans DSM 18569]
MDTTAFIVTIAGVGLAAFVIWYFFFSARQTASAVSTSGGVQEVAITVKGGYSPDVVEVERGKPVQLSFYRDEENSCSEELLMPDFNVRRDLPAFKTTLVELLPQQAGTFTFTCGMGMLRGNLVVK